MSLIGLSPYVFQIHSNLLWEKGPYQIRHGYVLLKMREKEKCSPLRY